MEKLPEISDGEQVLLEGSPILPFASYHQKNDDGVPTGGNTNGRGFTIAWQNGALKEDDTPGTLTTLNGAFVEDVIAAAKDRLEFYQTSPFANEYNEKAIAFLSQAISVLNLRTTERQERGVEGTHQI